MAFIMLRFLQCLGYVELLAVVCNLYPSYRRGPKMFLTLS